MLNKNMKKNLLPQEIEVWYLIPAIRRELAKIFIEKYSLSQKKAAQILGISEAAVSQYVKSKRANEIEFPKREIKIIEDVANEIIKKPELLTKKLYDLSVKFR